MVDEITPAGMPGLGLIEAKTSNYGGHPPEFWAERLTEKIVSSLVIAKIRHIKEQAKAYKDADISSLFDLYKKCYKIL